MLAFAVCGMVDGARSLYALALWGRHGCSPEQRVALGMRRGATPSVATLFRLFRDVDCAAFERALHEWLVGEGVRTEQLPVQAGAAEQGLHGEVLPGVHLAAAYGRWLAGRGDAASGARTVLVVEDDEPIRALLTTVLETELGARVLAAGDGVTALELAARERPEAVLLDMRLPRLSGEEVARRLKANPALRDAPIIGMSAAVDEADAQAAGCDVFVGKPFDVDPLLAMMRRLLSPIGGGTGRQDWVLAQLAHEWVEEVRRRLDGHWEGVRAARERLVECRARCRALTAPPRVAARA